MKNINSNKWKPFLIQNLGALLFGAGLLVSILSFTQYGLSWDEEMQRRTGNHSYKYVFEGDDGLLAWVDKDYGVAFEWPLVILENLMQLEDFRDVFLLRHFVTHLFFLFGAFTLYKLVNFLYDNKLLATIGFLLIVLHPRLYGHSFFNTKDIPFMSMYIIAMYYTARFFNKPTIGYAVASGVVIGLLTNFRIMGAMLFCMVFFFLLMDVIRERKIKYLWLSFIFLVSVLGSLYLSWPYLWVAPIDNFMLAFENMSKFRWGGDVRFMGDTISSLELPWTYIPVWFSITTPIVYIIVGVLSLVLLGFRFLKSPFSFFTDKIKRNQLIFITVFLAPVVLVVVLHSVLYDSWRQLFFIYPAFVMVIIYGVNEWLHYSKATVLLTFALTFGYISFFMIKNFPNQHVYFNQMTSKFYDSEKTRPFELDYWGVSHKQALAFILNYDDSNEIKVYVDKPPGIANWKFLPEGSKNRIQLVEKDQATYFLATYRGHPQNYDYSSIHAIQVGGRTIHEIFKLK